MSLNFENADLELVLRSIADITGINFIIGPGVKANVTMRTTTRVPATEVFSILESVLEINNLAAVKDGSYYKIVPIAVAQQEPQDVQVGKERTEERERFVTQIVQLEYLSADETSKILQSLMGKGAKMIVHKETNSLIIAGFTSTIKRVLETIKALDVPTKRDNIQRIFVYFVENAKAAELANTLNTLYGRRDLVRGAAPGARPGQPGARPVPGTPTPPAPVPGQPPSPTPSQPPPPSGAAIPPGAEAAPGEVVGDVTIVSDETNNALVIKTSPRNYEIIEATIKQLDIVPKQVVIELFLAQIRLHDSFSFSLEEIIKSGQFLVAGAFGGPLATGIKGIVQDPAKKLASGMTFAFVDKDNVRVVLNNLAEVTKVEVLATPHLLTANNKEAKIQIGQEVPIVTGQQTTSSLQTGGTSDLFRTTQQKDIGIIMGIKPHVNEKRLVTLDIENENIAIDQTSFGDTGTASFLKTTTKTSIVVEDGQTLLIGGIIRTDKSKGYTGIPFLSRIPLLGYLFRGTSDVLERNELIIMVTPHVIASPEEGRAMTERFRGRVERLEPLMKLSPKTSPSGLAPKLDEQENGDPGT
ncbi:Type II secretion system protein D precursor [Candidatus Methylomirabilis lanthanidiphila]|uniref:Type II secretion system protein D n=1 Tax=Candidatus Methylomirabilis lanthanidiphila TaxID=2211376 RepID=A0A564ZKY6_9BACT|nr:Type II secretion system protein D precursor [Candidatus Methylomirabilis lanthanidiphila]